MKTLLFVTALLAANLSQADSSTAVKMLKHCKKQIGFLDDFGVTKLCESQERNALWIEGVGGGRAYTSRAIFIQIENKKCHTLEEYRRFMWDEKNPSVFEPLTRGSSYLVVNERTGHLVETERSGRPLPNGGKEKIECYRGK